MAKGKNKSLAVGIVYKAVPIQQEDGQDALIIHVRGLSARDLSLLMSDDGGNDLGLAYRKLVTEATKPEDIERIALELIRALPDLVAKVIARAGDQPEQWEDVLDWAVGAQIEVIYAVAQLTFASESVRKKAMEIVARYADVSGPSQKPPTISEAGSGG